MSTKISPAFLDSLTETLGVSLRPTTEGITVSGTPASVDEAKASLEAEFGLTLRVTAWPTYQLDIPFELLGGP